MAGSKRSAAPQLSKPRKACAHAGDCTTPGAHADNWTQKQRSEATYTRRVTRHMRVDSPRQAVLNTTELLEHILGFLGPRELYACLRISRHIGDLIAKSVSLQRKMALRASDEEKQLWMINHDKSDDSAAYSHFGSEDASPVPQNVVMPVQLNFLLRNWTKSDQYAIMTAARSYKEGYQQYTVFNKSKSWPLDLTGPQSWHQAYLTDPPTKKAVIMLYWEINSDIGGHTHREVENEGGVTFGMVIGAALDTKDSGGKSWSAAWNFQSPGTQKDGTLREMLAGLEKIHKRRAVIRSHSYIALPGVTAPTRAEWQQMSKASSASLGEVGPQDLDSVKSLETARNSTE